VKTFLIALLIAAPSFAATEKKVEDSRPRLSPLTVTLDVKDAEVRDILKSMQQQCAIKNLVIDPQVQGKGTFFIRDVPCRTAFDIVLRTLGLKSVTDSNTLTAVERRR
jgi:type II secretory pathway component GspD/PulD (secretin)